MPPAPKRPRRDRSSSSELRALLGSRMLLVAVAVAAVVAGALVVASIVLSGGDDESSPTPTGSSATALIDGIPQEGTLLGSPDAAVVMLQYEDLQCPVCKAYSELGFRVVVEEYVRPGDVRLDFRGLDFLGDDSTKALSAVLAAARQDRAWQLIELLFANQGDENSGWVTDQLLRDLGAQIDGLDVEQMMADAATPEIAAEIEAVAEEAASRNVPGTPWFYVQIGDEQPYEVQPRSLEGAAFRPILDDALRE